MNRIKIEELPKAPEEYNQQGYQKLISFLQYQNFLYYTLDDPSIDDAEYDQMMQILKRVEEIHPDWLAVDSPSHKVGGTVQKNFPEIKHDPPMMSLDNITSFSELEEFEQRLIKVLRENGSVTEPLIYHGELKFDGVAVELVYEKGYFLSGSTRGDGVHGEDVTHNIRTVKNVPLKLVMEYPPDYLSVRGEIVMPTDSFLALNETLALAGKKQFANPRNGAAGSIRQQDSGVTASRNLYFFPYGIGKVVESELSVIKNQMPLKQSEIYEKYFKNAGFHSAAFTITGTIFKIEEFYKEIELKRSELDFDIDGIVLKCDNIELWERAGFTAKSPRYAVAYKFKSKSAVTELLEIRYQVGRTGIITPVAILKPVNIGGVVVQRATLHNIQEIKRLMVAPGDMVEVIRAGDVIPKIERSISKAEHAKQVEFPDVCMECGEPLEQEDIYIRCVNKECPGKNRAYLKFFVSKNGLDIDGFGEEWVDKLYQHKLIRNIDDIFLLNEEKLMQLDGMGKKLAANILGAIEARKSVSFEVFLRSLGILNVGAKVADILAENFHSLEALISAKKEDLVSINEIGPVIADSIVSYFEMSANRKVINHLFESGFSIDYPEVTGSEKPFEGFTFVFTGTLHNFSREVAMNIVKKLGGKSSSSVSRNTTYLVFGDEPGSKYKKAVELGVGLLTEEQFAGMIKKYEF